MDAAKLAEKPSLRLTRRFPVGPEKVWRAWTDPQALKQWFGPGGPQPVALAELDLLVNTTSLGMTGQPPLQIDLERLPGAAVVADIVYVPLETAFLRAARERGNRVVGGLGMLLHQAVRGFELWFGMRPEVTQDLYDFIAESIERGYRAS